VSAIGAQSLSIDRSFGLPALVGVATACASSTLFAKEDIEFVQEHLPEVVMGNRYATLPLWSGPNAGGVQHAENELQAAFSSTSAGDLTIRGALLSIARRWHVGEHWQIGAFAFHDALKLRGSQEDRDLQTLFAPSTPLTRPIAARFTGLDGTATDLGIGVNLVWRVEEGWLGRHKWIGGMLWQDVALDDYRFNYVIQAGPQTGASGTIDFDAQYHHVVPFVGLALPREHGNWQTNAHVLFAWPLPRRGIVGHITGPGFDIRGDTADAGNGKHFGDPSVTFGYMVTYRPAHLSIDLGTLGTQALLEPRVHLGIDRNFVLSFSIAL
jgi:hypothetical protein